MVSAILTALYALDVKNDNHWTVEGLPKLETVKFNNGGQAVTREQLEAEAPGFTRATAVGYALSGGAQQQAPAEQPPAEATQTSAQGDSAAGQGDTGSPQGEGAGADSQASAETPGNGDEGADGAGAGGELNQTEPGEVEELDNGDEADELEAVEAELAETREALDYARGQMDSVKLYIDNLVKHENALEDRRIALTAEGNANTNAIMQYLASQRKNLEERAVRKALIRESGLDLKELARDLKAPIDAAMARKTGRGGQRPTGR